MEGQEAAPVESADVSVAESPAPVAESPAPSLSEMEPPRAEAPVAPSAPQTPVPTPAAATAPADPDFDWTAWDGRVDALPDQWRDIGSKFHDYYSPRLTEYDAEIAKYRDWVDTLVMQDDDPKLIEARQATEKLQAEFDSVKSEFEQYRTQYDTYVENEAREYADWFKRTNPHVFESPGNQASFRDLLESGWEPEPAAKVLTMGLIGMALAKEAKEKGAPDHVAIEMAEMSMKAAAPRPTPSARLVTGSSRAAQAGTPAARSINDTKDPGERRRIAALNALRKHRGGR